MSRFGQNVPARGEGSLEDDVARVLEAQSELVTWSIDDLIDFFDDFSQTLLTVSRRGSHGGQLWYSAGVAYVAGWCRRSNLESVLGTALASRQLLDDFVPGAEDSDRSFRAFPRGLVVHWMPANVPTLGFLSLIMGVLTKNANIVKLSQRADGLLPQLLTVLGSIRRGRRSGEALVQSIAVVRHDRTQHQINEFLSQAADVRIFWGSDEAIESLKAFRTKPNCSDVSFPTRTSFAIIDRHSMTDELLPRIARRLALDISVFEQRACASPHTVFLETEDDRRIESFVHELDKALRRTLSLIPKVEPAGIEASAILNLRAQYDMMWRAKYSRGTEYTILCDDKFQLGPPIGNRVVFVRKAVPLERVAELVTPKVQTVGIIAEPERFGQLCNLLGQRGVSRFANFGTMTHFELPWDGKMLVQRLVRWSSRPTMPAFGVEGSHMPRYDEEEARSA